MFSATIRRVVRTGARSVHLPKSGVKMSYTSSRFAKIPPISKKALPWLGSSLAETALLGGFSLFRENRAFATFSSSLEEKDNSDVANSKENKNSNPYTWNVPLSMPYFVGRQALSNIIVARLEQAMQQSNVNPSPIVLSGMGGIGKTQLAIHCLHKLQTFSSVNRFWFEAESLDRLDAAYRSFYIEIIKPEEVLNIQATVKTGDIKAGGNVTIGGVVIQQLNLSSDDIRSMVKRWFTDHPDCILVYDNVKDYESIEKFLPTSSGQVMVLTRRAEWPANFTVHHLSALERVDSIKLLTELGQVEGEDKSVAELANKLEDLPLALAQAGAYIRYNKETAESYLKLYNKYRAEMLAEGTMPVGIAHVPVMVTWEMSLKEIDQQDASGITRTLFTLCAYGDPEGTLKILLRYYLETKKISAPELKVNNAIKQLRNYSLVEMSEDGNKLVVHRLVQEVTRIYHEKERMLQKEDLMVWYFPWLVVTERQFALLGSDKQRVDYLAQALAVLEHQERLFSEKENHTNLTLARLKTQTGSVLFHQGFYRAAKSQFERTFKIVEAHYGKDHVMVARQLNDLGNAYGSLGDHVKQRDYLERALKIQEAHYGENHVNVAITLANLGNAYGSLGDHVEEKAYLQRALKIMEAHYGENHVEVAATLNNLGNAYGSLGDYAVMRGYLERALEMLEAHYGKDHIEVAATLNNLGSVYGSLGCHKEGHGYLERALKIQEGHYGKDHVETVATLTNLGRAYGSLGDYLKKRDYLERALKIQEAHYGKDHVESTVTLTNLGIAYGSLGDHEKAQDCLERALKINEGLTCRVIDLDKAAIMRCYQLRVINEDDVEVAVTLANLGSAYGSLGDYVKARDYLERALRIQKIYYGKDHIEVAITLNNLGNAYGALGEHKRQRDVLERALKIFMDSPYHGKNHPSTQSVMHQLSSMPSVTQIPQTLFTPSKQSSPANAESVHQFKPNIKPNGQ